MSTDKVIRVNGKELWFCSFDKKGGERMQGTEVTIRVNGEELKLCYLDKDEAFRVASAIYDGAVEYDHQNFSVLITEKA